MKPILHPSRLYHIYKNIKFALVRMYLLNVQRRANVSIRVEIQDFMLPCATIFLANPLD